jgi:sterol carrier protein 2
MLDAQFNYGDVEHGLACFAYGDATWGQRVLYQFGMSSVPFANTSNVCASGSADLYLARMLVQSRKADFVLVVRFENVNPGSLKSVWNDRRSSTSSFTAKMRELLKPSKFPFTVQYFANVSCEHVIKYVSIIYETPIRPM